MSRYELLRAERAELVAKLEALAAPTATKPAFETIEWKLYKLAALAAKFDQAMADG